MSTDSTGQDQMHAADSARVQQFRAEIDDLKLKGGSAQNEKRLLALGVLLMVAGVVLVVVGGVAVTNDGASPADQRADMAQATFTGIALAIVGGFVFLRYSLARYLRFWLIRSTYEERANADRVVDAIERASGLADAPVQAPPPQVLTPPPAPAPAPAPAPLPGSPPA